MVKEYRKKGEYCVICWERYSERVILPCMHLSLCGECAGKGVQRCPMCKGVVRDVRQVYR
jgi:hypothetical protein